MPRKDQRASDETRAKQSTAMKAYAARPDSHLHGLHKSGADHPNWQGGIKPGYYRAQGFAAHGTRCQRCDKPATMIHHRDRNRRNSALDNLEPLCRACHAKEHFGQRVAWTCPSCGATLDLRPFEARTRKFCTRACKERSRGHDGRFH